MNLYVLNQMFKKLKIANVETAFNGKEALDKIDSHDSNYFDIIFLDCQMVEILFKIMKNYYNF